MIEHWGVALYLAALIGAGMWACWKADEPMVRTFVLLLLNWLVLAAARDALNDPIPLKVMLIADFMAGILILMPRVGDAQIVIGDLFFAQFGLTTVMMAFGKPELAVESYKAALNVIGGFQILFLLIGTNYGSGKRFRLAGSGGGYGRHHARGAGSSGILP